MKKYILFLLFAVFFSLQCAVAQKLTDEQVVKIVLAEKEKGSDEKSIAQKLLRQGVTPAQLRRIKTKYEQEQNGLGAVDISGINRSRTGNNKSEDKKNFMLVDSKAKYNKDEQQEMLQGEMSFLDIDSVAYYQNLLRKDEVYGRNLFNNELLTFEPAMNIPTPADYVLGAGDQVIVDVWGASQQSLDCEISPDGYIVIEGVGPIRLSGLTVTAANEHVKEVLGESYGSSSITLSVGTTRSVMVILPP